MGSVKKILLLSSSDDNGAHLYAVKVAEVLIEMGHEVKMLVKRKTQKKDFILQYNYPKIKESIGDKISWRIKLFFQPYHPLHIIDGEYAFNSINEQKINTSAEEIIRQIDFKPDFIFSGMTNLFMNSTDILDLQKASGAQVYTLMVDMNHLTGGCHFAWDCDGYIKGCPSYCPAIGDNPRAKIKLNVCFVGAVHDEIVFTKSSELMHQLHLEDYISFTKESIRYSDMSPNMKDGYFLNFSVGDFVGYSSIESIDHSLKTIFYNIDPESDFIMYKDFISYSNDVEELTNLFVNIASDRTIDEAIIKENQILSKNTYLDNDEKKLLLSIL